MKINCIKIFYQKTGKTAIEWTRYTSKYVRDNLCICNYNLYSSIQDFSFVFSTWNHFCNILCIKYVKNEEKKEIMLKFVHNIKEKQYKKGESEYIYK